MTKSQKYALELSKERRTPIVLFDATEVAMCMFDPMLFPMLPLAPPGWRHTRTIECRPFSEDEAARAIADLVTTGPTTYGFAMVKYYGENNFDIGAFEMVRRGARMIVVPFPGRAQDPLDFKQVPCIDPLPKKIEKRIQKRTRS